MSLFDATLLSDNNLDKHDYVARSVIADKAMSARYFSLPTEMMARAFESVIESCSDIKNAYLVDGTTKPDMYPVYPDMAHREEIYQALQGYFAPLGRSLSK